MKSHALASALSHFKKNDGRLYINGRSIVDIVKEYSTPMYIYDRSVLEWRRDMLRKSMPENVELYYAVKANPNIEILRKLGEMYDGLDVASAGEMKRGMEAGIAPAQMSFAGPGKSIDELHFAVSNGIGTISVENIKEIDHLRAIGKELNTSVNVLIRVNPSFELSGSGMKMGGGPKQFGIDSQVVPSLLAGIKDDETIIFRGIHIYSGSQNLDADAIADAFEKITDYAASLVEDFNVSMEIVNLGGGLGIPYFAMDQDVDLEKVGSRVSDLTRNCRAKLPHTQFVIEMGRFIVGECGLYVSKVLYKKISHNETFLILDGGMHHHLAASGNLGQKMVHRPMPMTTVNKLHNMPEKVNVVGPLCTPLDTFGFNVELPLAEEGDLIAVMNAGAYGYSASPQRFLSHKSPVEVLI